MKLYVGNLPFTTTAEAVEALFSEFGEVVKTHLISDGAGKLRGFGFVHFANGEEAANAQEALDGTEFEYRTLRVTVADVQDNPRPRERTRPKASRSYSEPEVVFRRRRAR